METRRTEDLGLAFARLTMILEDAGELASQGQANGQPQSDYRELAVAVHEALVQADAVVDVVLTLTDDAL